MLYANISPSAKFAKQDNPFGTSVITEASMFSASARPYHLGGDSVRFDINFGNPKLDANNVVVGFERVGSSNVTLTAGDIAGWGTDDSVILSTIAAKLGTSVTSVITLERK